VCVEGLCLGEWDNKGVLYEKSVSLKNLKFYYSWTLLLNMREKNMANSPLTNDQRSKEYYRIAYQCAETKNTTGCNNNCATCPLNVHLYVDDARDATLIKTSAAMDYGKATVAAAQRNANNKIDNILQLVKVIFVAALLFSIVYFPISCFKNVKNSLAIDNEVKTEKRVLVPWLDEEPTTPLPPTKTYKATQQQLERILYCTDVSKDYYFIDMTCDGLYDCIDATMIFYFNYLDYDNNIKIIWNYNPNTKWSHLFCSVPDGYGSWLYIECTRYGDALYKVMVDYVWGKDYDPRYNKDVTQDWRAIIDNEHIWRW
jgi:hypothetical protein